jgi:hypothetical protein
MAGEHKRARTGTRGTAAAARDARATAAGRAPSLRSSARASRLPSILLALAAFALYLAQAPPVSGDKDSAEFTLVLALGGVAHPTGYPLFTLLGHAWVLFVHGLGATWAYAANSWTALGGGVAMYALHRLGLALLRGGPARGLDPRLAAFVAAVPVAWFACNPNWTYETTLAEVYAWHLAWALTAANCFANWMREGEGPAGPPGSGASRLAVRAATWGLLCGIGAVHHATFVFVAAPLTVALIVRAALDARGQWRTLVGPCALGVLAALPPLATDLIILARASHPGPGVWPTLRPGLDGLLEHISGRQYSRLVAFGGFAPSVAQVGLLREYTWPYLVAGGACLVAAFALARRAAERWTLGTLLAAAALGVGFALSYEAPDPSSYFLVPTALGLAAFAPLTGLFLVGAHAVRTRALVAAGLLSLAAVAMWVPWNTTSFARVRLYVSYDAYLQSMWHSIPFDSAFVFWDDDMYPKLIERQVLDHERPGLAVLHPITLMNEAPRRRFTQRFGFDPWTPEFNAFYTASRAAGGDSLFARAEAAVEGHVNAMSPWPVIHFDPRRSEVRLLKKPGAKPVVPPPPR